MAADVRGRAVGGLRWSLLNTLLGRSASLVAGIVVARILVPEAYGVFAVGFVVLTVLLSMNDLGVSQAVVRESADVGRVAPTVITVSVGFSALLFAACWFAAPGLAGLLGAPAATGVIRLLAVGVIVDAVVAVPAAQLTREFRQRRRLLIDTTAMLVGNGATVALALNGAGAWSLAIGATGGAALGGVLTTFSVGTRYRPGFDTDVARELFRFGLPLAGASLLLFALLNLDYVVVGHVLGPTQLGFYLLAFNLCSWPITIVVVSVRRIALAAFARLRYEPDGGVAAFTSALATLLVVTLPLCGLLALFGSPVVALLYGSRWAPAGPVVSVLAVLTVGRIVTELAYDFLVAVGSGRGSLGVYAAWTVALVPAMIIGVERWGIVGAAVAHAVVVVVVVVPVLAVTLRRRGVQPGRLWHSLGRSPWGLAALVVVGLTALVVTHTPVVLVLVGGALSLGAYVVVCGPDLRQLRGRTS